MGPTILRPGAPRLIVPGARVFQPSMASATFNVLSLSGLLLWLDAQDAATVYTDSGLTTLATANGTDAVGGWKDKSGNNNHIVQASSTKRPVYFNNAIGGKNAIKSDGVDDYLSITAMSSSPGTGDFYLAIAVMRHSLGSAYRAFCGHSGNLAFYYRSSANDTLLAYLFADKQFNSTLSNSIGYVVEFWRSGGTLRAALNGTTEANSYSNATSLTTPFFVFADQSNADFGNISIAELILSKAMPTDRTQVSGYLKTRYGIS